MKIDSLVPNNNIYRQGWSKWVVSKDTLGVELTDKNQVLTADYWACKKAYTAGFKEGQRSLDE